jgi:hypothetical protein
MQAFFVGIFYKHSAAWDIQHQRQAPLKWTNGYIYPYKIQTWPKFRSASEVDNHIFFLYKQYVELL